MANLKEIKVKIGSVKNTQKTTKAMKLVSSAKLTRTRQLSEQARSYSRKINDVLSDIAARVSKVQDEGNIGRTFIQNDNPKTVDIVFVTADKGLCGGFNMSTIKTVSKLIADYESKGTKVRLRAAGRKGVDFFSFQGKTLEQRVSDLSSAPDYERASSFIHSAVEDFKNELTDKVIVVYNGFLNMLTQEIRIRELLPISLEKVEISENSSMLNIEPEDDDDEVLKELTDKYIDFNMSTIKTVSKLIADYESKGTKVRLRAAGRKGVDFFSFQGKTLEQKVSDLSSAPDYERASSFIHSAVEDFKNELTDKVIVVYNGFLNMLTQEIRIRELLPVSLEKVEISENSSMLNIEPDDDDEVLRELTDKYIDFNMYYALIDSLAAEHSARMQAMEAATKNAKEKVDSLTVEYNKARQAAITTELIEIISGVEALK